MLAEFLLFLTNALNSRQRLSSNRRLGFRRSFSSEILERRIVLAAAMVSDINSVGFTSNPQNLTSVGSEIYFAANDGLHGPEIWKTDGTGPGTSFVIENLFVNPYSLPTELTAFNNQLFFEANGDLWRTDGTVSGTQIVFDTAGPQYLTVFNGALYFRDSGKMWKSDGTAGGTAILKDVSIGQPVVAAGQLYFPGYDATNGFELWKSDGTVAGTVMTASIVPGTGSSSPRNLAAVGSKIYFAATDGNTGSELWSYDTTSGSAALVVDIYSGSFSSDPQNLTPSGTNLYFTAYSPSSGNDLWRVDTITGVTTSVGDIWTHGSYAWVSMLDAAGTFLYAADGGGAGVELRGIDSSGVSVLLADINPSGSSNPQWLTYSAGKVYFSADDGVSGAELWSFDITTNTLAIVADINSGALGSEPEQLTVLGSDIYFTADGGPEGRELWKFDGIAAALVKDIAGSGSGTNSSNPGIYLSGGTPVSSPAFTALSGKLLFGADDGRHGIELWGSDGTAGGTAQIKDINSAVIDTLPPGSVAPTRVPLAAIESNQVILNGMAYFGARDRDNNLGLWKTDGTEAGTALVKNGYLSGLTVANGKIYFYGSLGTGTGLCKSDGTTAGTVLVKALSAEPEGWVASGNLLFFAGFTTAAGVELWKSDGTAAGTVMVKDIYVGPYGSLLGGFTDLNGAVVFTAYTPVHGYELWRSDGTSAGTYELKDTFPGAVGGEPGAKVNVDGTLYFVTRTGPGGGALTELWTSDGTTSGTVRVAIVGGMVNSLTAVGGKVFFPCGADLWISDGSAAGTMLVKSGLNPQNLTDVFGTLYFSADDGTHGRELWKSDGTAAGTVMVHDINVGTGGSAPGSLTKVNWQLYFTASVPEFGRELWKLDIAYPDATVLSASANGAATVNVTYQVFPDEVSTPFGLTFYRSLDGIIDATDTLLGVVMASDASVGVHSQSFTIGSDIFLPGFGMAEIDGDYQILVAPLQDPIASVSLTGAYHASNGGVFVHGGAGSDSIAITTSGVNTVVTVSGVASYSYLTTDIASSGFRVRSQGGDDTINGAAAAKSLFAWGGAGSDILTGSAGANDSLTGGSGDDVYVFVAATATQTDTLTELANEGVDRLDFSGQASTVAITVNLASATTTLATHTSRTVQVPVAGAALWFEQVTGGSGNDTIVGNGSANVLIGGAGNDALTGGEGDDVLTGGAGNDVYNFGPAVASQSDTVIELGNGGIDRLDFTSLDASNSIAIDLSTAGLSLGGHNNRNIFVGAAGQSIQIENVTGGSGNDTISGNSANNSIIGGAGDDTLAGGIGIDSIVGGLGIDLFLESANWSTFTLTDTAFNAGTSESLSSIERAILIGGISNNTFNASGFSGPVTIQGGSGNDTISGGKSDDVLEGGPGDDVYMLDTDVANGTDTIDESGGGLDTLDFTLTTTLGVTVDLSLSAVQVININQSLILGSGTTVENVKGGSLDDVLTGNTLANTLTGNTGNDTLIGGAGNDALNGSVGDDLYLFDADDSLGSDTLTDTTGLETISFAGTTANTTLNLGLTTTQNVSGVNGGLLKLTLASATTFDNVIGGDGNDTLTSGAGVGNLTGGAGNDTLTGGAGINTLTGGAGTDQLAGGAGNDTYLFDADSALGSDTLTDAVGTETISFAGTTANVIFSLGSTAVQSINGGLLTITLVSATTFDNVIGGDGDDVLTSGSGTSSLTGGAGNDTLTGGAGTNTLTGGAGDDQLYGGAGNDTYLFDADTALGSDSLTDLSGTETISFAGTTAGVTLSLGLTTPQIVNGALTLTLASATTFDNLIGGDGNDVLTGNGGVNSLTGELGDDTLDGSSGNDTLIGAAGNDTLDGNTGNDTLTGGAGDDTLIGGPGDDVYALDTDAANGTDTINESGGGLDTLDFTLTTTQIISVDLSQPALQVVTVANQSLILGSGTTIENVKGGSLGDVLTGNTLANTLTGNAGNDTLNGLDGDDLLIGNAGNDILNGGLHNDVYQFDVDAVLGSDTINDPAGVDALDFALSTTVGITLDLTVNSVQALHATNMSLTLPVGTVIETVLGTAKNDTILGNDADNILVGNAGNDVLLGGAGRDILIGGLGADTLDGGADDDILIGGKTTSDALISKLNDLRAEWISANLYGTRITNLRAGVGPSTASLKAKVTVTNDATSGSVDTMTGDAGEDWFFAALDDVITDLLAGETLDLL